MRMSDSEFGVHWMRFLKRFDASLKTENRELPDGTFVAEPREPCNMIHWPGHGWVALPLPWHLLCDFCDQTGLVGQMRDCNNELVREHMPKVPS